MNIAKHSYYVKEYRDLKNNNIPDEIPQVRCGKDKIYADLITTLEYRDLMTIK